MSATEAANFVKEVWGLQGTAYVVLGLRYYARISKTGWSSLAWDDGLMFLATLAYTAESVMAYMVVAYWQGFANNGMTDAEREALDPNSVEYTLRVNGSKTHVTGLLLYATLLWLLKGCWVVYYARLTDGVASRYRLVVIGAWMIPVTFLSCVAVAVFKCVPFNHQWQINPSPGNHCMPAVSVLQTVYVMSMNTVTDIYLMMIPIPMIWTAQLPWKKKASIILLFSGGFVELIFGILRCVSILTVGDTDPAQSGFWSVRESFVSFVLTNLPFIYPLIKGYIDKTRPTANKSGNAYATGDGIPASGKKGYRLDSLSQGTKKSQRGLPRTASQELIVGSPRELQYQASAVSMKQSTEHSSQESVATANFSRGLSGPADRAGVTRATASSSAFVPARPSRASEVPNNGQGILVTRMYEVREN